MMKFFLFNTNEHEYPRMDWNYLSSCPSFSFFYLRVQIFGIVAVYSINRNSVELNNTWTNEAMASSWDLFPLSMSW